MTVKKPKEFCQECMKYLLNAALHLFLLPHLKNSGVNGAVKWVTDDRVVLAINNRGVYADKFWFLIS